MPIHDQVLVKWIGAVDTTLLANPIVLPQLKSDLIALLDYLASPSGRTDENCRAVDNHFQHHDAWAKMNLPSDFRDLLADMAGILHDAVSAPSVAQNFESTPEQLLDRAKKLAEQCNRA